MADRRLKIIAEAVGFSRVARQANLLANGLTTVAKAQKSFQAAGIGSAASGQLAQSLAPIQKTTSALKQNITTLQRTSTALAGFQMQYLGTMFFGMQVWRTFGGFFKSMLTSMKDLDKKGTNPLNRALTKLEASFTFLKFAIADALGPAFVQFVVNVAEALLSLADADPAKLRAIGLAIGVIAIGGLAMFTFSQIALFHNAVNDMLILGNEGKPSMITNMAAAMRRLALSLLLFTVSSPFLAIFAAIATAGAIAVSTNKELVEEFKTDWVETAKSIGEEFLQLGKDIGLIPVDVTESWTFFGAVFVWISKLLQIGIIAFAKFARVAVNAIMIIAGTIFSIGVVAVRVYLSLWWGVVKAIVAYRKLTGRPVPKFATDTVDSLSTMINGLDATLIKANKGLEDYYTNIGETLFGDEDSSKRLDELFQEIRGGPQAIYDSVQEERISVLDAEIEKAEALKKLIPEAYAQIPKVSPFDQLASDILGTPQSYAQVPTTYGSE